MRLQYAPNSDNTEIQRQIKAALPAATAQAEIIAERFRGKDLEESAKNVWKFLRDHVKYSADTNLQSVKLPAALLRDRTGDCKSYSIFAHSILSALGYKNFIRFTGYNANFMIPSHVYNVVEDDNGKQTPVDGTLSRFGVEDRGHFKIDYKSPTMDVETITGKPEAIEFPGTMEEYQLLTDPTFDNFTSARIKILKKYNLPIESVGITGGFFKKLKNIGKKIGQGIKKAANKVVQVAAKVFPIFVAGRLAFLTLVKNNYNGMATKLAQIFWKNPSEKAQILEKWKKWGGNDKALADAINNGKGIGISGGSYDPQQCPLNGPGLALLAQKAAAIIKALLPFLKKVLLPGAEPEEKQVEQVEQQMTPQQMQQYQEELRLLQNAESTADGSPEGYINFDQQSNNKLNGKGSNMGVVLGVAALALLLMNKK
jgi:hypothetical protein